MLFVVYVRSFIQMVGKLTPTKDLPVRVSCFQILQIKQCISTNGADH